MRLYEYYTDSKKEITVILPNEMSKTDVSDLEEYFKTIIKQVKRTVK